MIAPHCRDDIAPVPESVSQSISTSSARSLKTFSLAASSRRSRSTRLVMRIGSMLLMRKGSISVLGITIRLEMRACVDATARRRQAASPSSSCCRPTGSVI